MRPAAKAANAATTCSLVVAVVVCIIQTLSLVEIFTFRAYECQLIRANYPNSSAHQTQPTTTANLRSRAQAESQAKLQQDAANNHSSEQVASKQWQRKEPAKQDRRRLAKRHHFQPQADHQATIQRNNNNDDSSTAPSHHNQMPTFSEPIGNVTAVLGRDVRLVCTVEHLGQHQVAWLREESGTILSIDTNIIITNYRIFLIPDEKGRKWVLHIKDVQESDRGFYQCQVNTNPMRSTSGYLEVVVPPKMLEAQTSQMAEVEEHANVSIQCKSSGHPRPTITWRREDGQPIRLLGSTPVAERTPAGSLGGGDGGQQQLISSISRFEVAAQAKSRPLGKRVGDVASGADSLVAPVASNLRNSNNIDHRHLQPIGSQLDDVKSDKLSLISVDRTMAGLYVCSATNGISGPQASKRIPVYVKFAPQVSVQNKYISVSEGDQLEVECLIEAHPKANSYWYRQQKQRQKHEQQPRRRHPERRQLHPMAGVAGGGRYVPEAVGAAGALSLRQTSLTPGPQLRRPPPNGSTIDTQQQSAPISSQLVRLQRQRRRRKRLATSQVAQLPTTSDNGDLAPAPDDRDEKSLGDDDQTPPEAGAHDDQRLLLLNWAGGGGASIEQQHRGQRRQLHRQQVTVKQTPINSYTWQLKLSIKRMELADFGEYTCVARNQMGESEASIWITRADEEPRRPDDEEDSLPAVVPTTTTLSSQSVGANELDLYQRDSLMVPELHNNNNHPPSALNGNQQQRAGAPTGRQRLASSSVGQSHHRVVYDENYLQAIKNRGLAAAAAASSLGGAASGNQFAANHQATRLQQKLSRMKQSAAADSRNSAAHGATWTTRCSAGTLLWPSALIGALISLVIVLDYG